MLVLFVSREGEAALTTDWAVAYQAGIDKIEAHPRFNDLVKAVGAAEYCVPMRGLAWMQRNSRTYGMWATRLVDGSGGGAIGATRMSKARARRLCTIMTDQLFPKEERMMPDGEYEAKVWVAARNYAAARVLKH